MIESSRYDNITTIPVTYNDRKLRSTLEGRWAVVFDALGISWEYEQGVDLGHPLGWYCPDFWLPAHKTYIEVKGPIPTANELEKLRALWNGCGQNVNCAILGEIPTSATESPFPGGDATTFFFPASAYFAKHNLLLLLADNDQARLAAAYDAARSYQFIRTNQEIERLKADNERMKAEIERLRAEVAHQTALAQEAQTAKEVLGRLKAILCEQTAVMPSDILFSLDHVIAAWPSILDDVKQSDKMLWSVLRDVQPFQVDGLELTLQAKSDFHRKQVEKNFLLIETVVRKRFGLNIILQFQAGSKPPSTKNNGGP